MFHSSIFTMASNITPDEDEPMHPAGPDMTRGSLQGILDGDEVNVSTALPTVPLDATNPFINPNQTQADIIPGRNLGPLSSLKIMDADLIISNLNNEINAAVEKNDQSTTLLQRMDQHQKQIKTQLAELKAQTKQKKRKLPLGKNTITPSIKKGLQKIFGMIWKKNMPIECKIT